MSYWIRMSSHSRGPFSVEEVTRMPDVQLNTLLCPGGQDIQDRRNWRFARAFPDVRETLLLLGRVCPRRGTA